MPELVMSTPTVRLLRPFLNRWLRGFHSASSNRATPVTANSLRALKVCSAGLDSSAEDSQGDVDGDAEFADWESSSAVFDQTVDLGYLDPTETPALSRRDSRRSCLVKESSGVWKDIKSGEVKESEPLLDRRRSRRRIRHAAIRRLSNGQLVEAKSI
mmetsp:Transcript_45069/g.116788  ORF Transcript_45069/g.116788 Transcript_45069/m.116788 type:complete len:157 (-) Transcript_45069:113-583(-)